MGVGAGVAGERPGVAVGPTRGVGVTDGIGASTLR